ncbi:hypothetical protein [Shouchella lonarensis]|uniref:Uncharacterized protein n=1 Tax=Shouchella lonarensis TaxID=1464122 RepID=A0A1G6JQ30_9BACI|nr:hypothetical protein [Shouchella lonarensis]SDC20086.1 hypothetical protein SAMN05421737_10641 [Shouchella lonarensis]
MRIHPKKSLYTQQHPEQEKSLLVEENVQSQTWHESGLSSADLFLYKKQQERH